ncbi:MAG: polysaccharide deacetylase family protein [Bacteroidota bacterium]
MHKNLSLLLLFLWPLFSCEIRAQATIQEQLGYPKETKLLIIHADDFGVSQSENAATIAAMEQGMVNSSSIMVPCPWFPAAAAYAKKHPEMDWGIHLTLTSEWIHYKWGPVANRNEVRSLLDDSDYFYPTQAEVRDNADLKEVELELRAQIDRALQFGVPVTHLDIHMFTLWTHPELVRIYKKLGREYQLPILLNRLWLDRMGAGAAASLEQGDVVVDHLHMALSSDHPGGLEGYYAETISKLESGLNVLLIHTAYDNAEMQAVAIERDDFGSAWRQVDFDFFTSQTCRDLLDSNNIQLVTWKEIRDKLGRK